MATSPSALEPKQKTGVTEVKKLLEGNTQLTPRSTNLAVTAVMLEKLKTTINTNDDSQAMYVFDKDGNKVTL